MGEGVEEARMGMDDAVETVVTRFRSVKGSGDAYGDVEQATREKIDNLSDDERRALLLALRPVRVGPDSTGLSRSDVVCLLTIFRYVESVTDPDPIGQLPPPEPRDATQTPHYCHPPAYRARVPSVGRDWLAPLIVWTIAVLSFLVLLGIIEQGL